LFVCAGGASHNTSCGPRPLKAVLRCCTPSVLPNGTTDPLLRGLAGSYSDQRRACGRGIVISKTECRIAFSCARLRSDHVRSAPEFVRVTRRKQSNLAQKSNYGRNVPPPCFAHLQGLSRFVSSIICQGSIYLFVRSS
jgi:hypothetical protein